MKTIEFILPSWVLCPLFNSDNSGITEEENQLLTEFVEENLKEHKSFWAINAEELGFRHSNDLDGLAGSCHLVTFSVRR